MNVLGVLSRAATGALILTSAVASSTDAAADQGGVGFWLPGLFGSFAASPLQPGWSLSTLYYHTSVDASGGIAAARQIKIGQLSPTVNVSLDVNLKAKADLVLVVPQYTFDTRIFGGQLAINITGIYGRNSASLNGTLIASLDPYTFTQHGSLSESVIAFADLFPQASLRWNAGVHNLMIYAMTNIGVGSYDSKRIANLGLGFNAWDGGMAYTYFDPTKGQEFSVTAGVTYNNWNHHTNYRNGLDYHIDAGAAQFLNKQFYVGAGGYIYSQLTADDGSPAFLGDVKSRVFGIGPQLGYMFEAAPGIAGLLAVKGHYEFEARDRPDGWNVWLTLNLSPAEKREQVAVSKPRPVWK